VNEENVRDRKRITRQLQEALDYAENIVSTIREPLLVLDGSLRIISANQSFYRVFSISQEETEGKLIYEVGRGDWNIPKLRELLQNILTRNTSFENYEVDHEFPSIGWKTMLLNARRLHDGGVKTQKILLAIEDITERKLIEREKSSSELRYRRLFETAQDGILILDAPTGIISDVNPFLLKRLGYSSQDMKGKKLWEIGLFKDAEASRQAFRVLQDKGYIRYEDLPLETKDGQLMQVEFISNLYTVNGDKVIQCNIRDITDRKKAEFALIEEKNKMENVLNSTSDGFFTFDANFRFTYFNRAAEEILGRKASEVVGLSFVEAFPQAKGSVFEEHYLQALKDRKPLSFESYFELEPYQNWYDVRVFPSKEGIAVFFQAITERKKAEELLQRNSRELEATNKELEAFSYSISHDLRAPLRTLDGFSEAVLQDYGDRLDENGRDYLYRIRKASQKMSQLIEDILKLSRITVSDTNRDEVNLSDLVESIADDIKDNRPERQVDFVIQPGITTQGDIKLLEVALRNLMENSWKFTNKSPRARIEFGVNSQNGKQVYFLADNGVGFDMKYAERLFQPFRRLHSDKEFPGTGIGLATVQRVIHRHGGRIWADSKVGGGATFYFTLE
jgi:PAS domain S-box-containing protein